MVSDTTDQYFIKATSKNKVDLSEILSSFAQVISSPTQMDFSCISADKPNNAKPS